MDCAGVVPWRLPCQFQPPGGNAREKSAPAFQVGALNNFPYYCVTVELNKHFLH